MPHSGVDKQVWPVLMAMAGVGGLIVLDETVVSVALPAMRNDLAMSAVASHWIVSVYVLVFSGFTAAGGKLGDIFGLRRMFLASLSIFAIASLAAGLAPSGWMLIAARAAQGLGAGVMFPASIAIVSRSVDEKQRGYALGIVVAIATLFMTAGPLVGGLFTELLSWRWIFFINLPVALLAILFVLRKLPEYAAHPSAAGFDGAGLATMVAGLLLIVFAIMQAGSWGVADPAVLAAFAAGIAFLAAFVRIENSRDDPLIEVERFRIPRFSAALAVIGAAQFSKMVILVIGALYLQDDLKMSPTAAGWVLLASVLLTPVTAGPAGRISDRFGERRPILFGLGVAMAMVAAIALLTPERNYLYLLPALLVWGATLPICFQPAMRIVMNAVPAESQGQASGLCTAVRMFGATLGMAFASLTLSLTDTSYQAVFAMTAALMAVVLALAILTISEKSEQTEASAH